MHQSPRAHVAKKGHSIDARDRWSRRGSTATAGPPGMVPGARRSSEAEECENRPGDHTGALKNDRHQRFMKPLPRSCNPPSNPPLQTACEPSWGGIGQAFTASYSSQASLVQPGQRTTGQPWWRSPLGWRRGRGVCIPHPTHDLRTRFFPAGGNSRSSTPKLGG